MYAAWNRGEHLGAPGLLDETVEYANPPGAVEPGIRRGLAAFGEAAAKVLEAWESWHMEPQEFEARGDHVAVALRFEGRGRGSGVAVEGRESALWTIRDGRVVRYAWFHGPADAFRAAGIER
jgi:ketosteroid isomerase-like protein